MRGRGELPEPIVRLDLPRPTQKNEEKQFQYDYQRWYTKDLKAVALLARCFLMTGRYRGNPSPNQSHGNCAKAVHTT